MQDLIACLALLGTSLTRLDLTSCNDIFTPACFQRLWVAPCLKQLVLGSCNICIDVDDVNAVMKELRCTTSIVPFAPSIKRTPMWLTLP